MQLRPQHVVAIEQRLQHRLHVAVRHTLWQRDQSRLGEPAETAVLVHPSDDRQCDHLAGTVVLAVVVDHGHLTGIDGRGKRAHRGVLENRSWTDVHAEPSERVHQRHGDDAVQPEIEEVLVDAWWGPADQFGERRAQGSLGVRRRQRIGSCPGRQCVSRQIRQDVVVQLAV